MSGEPAILVLQHIACEPLAVYADELGAHGIPADTLLLDDPAANVHMPDWRAYRGVVAMGGPMGAYDDALYPWLPAEKSLIADAVAGGLPYWGVCLGAQLLAAALGAPVSAGRAPEIGVLPVRLSPAARADPVFALAPAEFDALHWHGDTYELPQGATHLASSAQYEQQAFVLGRAYAVQFHLEVSAQLVREWAAVPAYRDGLERAGDADALGRLLADLASAEDRLNRLARELFGRWLQDVVLTQPSPCGRAEGADEPRPAQNGTGLPLGTTSTEPREESSTERA